MIVKHVMQIKNGIMTNANVSVKRIVRANNRSACICENSGYLESIVDYSVVACHEIISAVASVLKNVANTISTNLTSTVSINLDDKK